MIVSKGISKGQLVPLLFGQDAVAASQTDVQLLTPMSEASTAGLDGYVMPFPWEVVAISSQVSAAATAGTLTIGASVAGTEDADTTLTITTAVTGYKRISRGKMRGVAGAVVGAEITTNGDWDGTSSDLSVVVWVLLALEGI